MASDSATLELLLAVDVSQHDRLIAELDLLGFEAFLQDDHQLRAYAPFPEWTPELAHQVEALLSSMSISVESRVRIVAPENWNERWEHSIEPMVVGRFIVTPSWRRNEFAEKGLVPLEIDPKMSFGTGYHATTRLMLRMLPTVIRRGDHVLDAGTGTGILAIAAARLGASRVLGVDVDPWSERNARENCERNGVSDIVEIQLAGIVDVPSSTFDVILANIQLDVIVASLDLLATNLRSDGCLLVSGILLPQSQVLTAAAVRSGLAVTTTESEGEWWAAALRRT